MHPSAHVLTGAAHRSASGGLAVLVLVLAAAALAAPPPRLPVPDEPSQEKARSLARQVFADDFAEAKKSAEKGAALATKLLAHAAETPQPPARYALLQLAAEAAAQAGDVALTVRALGQLDKNFQIDAALKLQALKTLSRSVRGSEPGAALIQQLESLVDERLAADDYPAASEAARLAVDEARKTRDPALRRRAVSKLSLADELAAAHRDLKAPLETLAKTPADPAAHLAVGRFLCFLKGDWTAGLPHLAAANDAALKTAAGQELAATIANPQPPVPTPLSLADAWWDLAQTEQGTPRAQIARHAEYWYRLGLAGLTGLDRARVEQRLAEVVRPPVQPPAAPAPKPRRPPALKIKILLAAYGKSKKAIDVTAAVQAAVAKDPFLPIRADTVLTGGVDPAPYQQRLLLLRYQVGKTLVERRLHEGTVETIPPVPAQGLALPDAAERFTIVAARYGAGVTWIDATAHVAQLVSDPQKPFDFHAADLADDEARKTCHALVIWFDYQHRRYVRVFEHSRKCLLLP